MFQRNHIKISTLKLMWYLFPQVRDLGTPAMTLFEPQVPTKKATFGMSWFWFPEALFGAAKGVIRTRVGYAGGTKPIPPSYHNLVKIHSLYFTNALIMSICLVKYEFKYYLVYKTYFVILKDLSLATCSVFVILSCGTDV